MDALTGRRRRNSSSSDAKPPISTPPSSSSSSRFCNSLAPTGVKEFVPELYSSRGVGAKRFRAEQPENEEERELMRSLPCDTESALQLLRTPFPSHIFEGRLPPIILYSQLGAILSNQFLIDTQLSKLAKENKILTFSTFTSSNYLIVFLKDFVDLRRDGIFERFVSQVVAATGYSDKDGNTAADKPGEREELKVQTSLENSKYFSKEGLRKRWKFEEDDIRKLVNNGYLGIQEGGMYCMSLPGAGEFIKCFEKGKKAVLGAIKRAKFGEILQSELVERPMKKAAPLGVLFHIYDLIGSGEIDKIDTTSGPLLRLKRKARE